MKRFFAIVALLFASLSAFSQTEYGVASYYSDYYEGRRTASGETFRQAELTAAHKTLPFGTLVRVYAPDGSSSVVVTITDRGPFTRGRVIDLSKAAAERIGLVRRGLMPVTVEVLENHTAETYVK